MDIHDEHNHPLPNAAQDELLAHCIEECAEVIQRATKMQRFGVDQVQPGRAHSNLSRLSEEIGNLFAVFAEMEKVGVLDLHFAEDGVLSKQAGMRKYLRHHVVDHPPPLPGWADTWRAWVNLCLTPWSVVK